MSDLSDLEDDIGEIENKFNRAAKFLQSNVDKIDQSLLLECYGLYKQATVGKCNTKKPGIFNLQQKSKWNAWNNLGEMEKQIAMESYIEKIDKFNPEWDFTEIDKDQWNSVSAFKNEDEPIEDSDKNIFDFVKEGNTEKFLKLIKTKLNEINNLDDSGMGLIHWASDRGDSKILDILIQNKAEINLKDSDGQTALHYSSSCGNVDCVKLLIKYGAEKEIVDNDGSTCMDIAFDKQIFDLLNS